MGDRLRVVAGAVVRDGRVLAARRGPQMALGGYWELPGGKVEDGEDDREALARELREELDVDVEVGRRIGEAAWDGGRRPLLLVAYRCTLAAGEPRAIEHDALRWVGPESLDALDWAPADVPLVEALRAELGGPTRR